MEKLLRTYMVMGRNCIYVIRIIHLNMFTDRSENQSGPLFGEPLTKYSYSSNSAITTYPLSGAFSTLTMVPSFALILCEFG